MEHHLERTHARHSHQQKRGDKIRKKGPTGTNVCCTFSTLTMGENIVIALTCVPLKPTRRTRTDSRP